LPFRIRERDYDLDVRGLDEIIRDLSVLREGKISHLTIPAFLEKYVTESLKSHIPYLEVRDTTSCNTASLILLQIHQDHDSADLPNALSSQARQFFTRHDLPV